MKITLVSSLFGISGGGSGIIVERLAQGLSAKGHVVSVVTTGLSLRPLVVDQLGFKVYSFHPLNFYNVQEKDLQPAWRKALWQILDIYNPFVIQSLLKIFKEETPDVIHIHKMRGFSGAIWFCATKISPQTVVQTCHDYESISPQGLLQGHIGQLADEGAGFMRWYQFIRKNLADQVAVVTAPSQYTLKKILSHGIFSSSRPFMIPNTHGYSLADLKFLRDKLEKKVNNSGEINLLYIGRLEPEKGIRELCKAFSEALVKISNLKLTIAGWGTMTNELVRKYGGNPSIRLLGRIQGEERDNVFAESDVIVLPSLVPEAFGMVIIESYAFGKPVIVSNRGGMPELVSSDTGWIVDLGNNDVLSELFYKLGNEPNLLQKMTGACFEKAKSFSLDRIVGMYEEIYNTLRN